MAMSSTSFHLFTSVRHDAALLHYPADSGSTLTNGKAVRHQSLSPSGPRTVQTSPQSILEPWASCLYLPSHHLDRFMVGASFFGWLDAQIAIASIWPDARAFSRWVDEEVELWRMRTQAQGKPAAALKARISLLSSGRAEVTFAPVPALPDLEDALFPARLPTPDEMLAEQAGSRRWRVTMDPEMTSLHHQATSREASEHDRPSLYFKTSRRLLYDAALARVNHLGLRNSSTTADAGGRDLPLMPILHNSAGHVTEGAYASVYFFRDGQWVTPPVTELDAAEDDEAAGAQAGTTRRWAIERGLVAVATVERDSVTEGEVIWLSTGVRGFGWGRLEE